MACAKKYEENHPNERVSMIQNTKIPIDCEYCNKHKALHIIPFSDTGAYVSAKHLVYECDCGIQQIVKINYCPMCGRKLD